MAREAIFETALRLEEWAAALRQFPSLLENSAVRRVLSLQVWLGGRFGLACMAGV